MLQTAVEAARRAGQVIAERFPAERFPAERCVTVKGYRDVVTDVDVAAETVILDLVRARFPDHTVISEEAGGGEIGSGYTWVVDPLDGTTNYSRRLPVFGVSVGVLEVGEPYIGVVYDPLRDHLFAAQRGGGATLNSAPIHVSRVESLGRTLVGLDWGHADDARQASLNCLGRVVPLCGAVRALGSATLALAYVAAGWLDVYFHLSLKPWDAAAGLSLIAEAGGRCTTLDGEPFRVDSPDCLATNGLVHDELLAVMASTLA